MKRSAAWEGTILRCLEREPGDRYSAVGEVIDGLLLSDEEVELESQPATPNAQIETSQDPSAKPGRNAVVRWSVLILALIATLIFFWILRT